MGKIKNIKIIYIYNTFGGIINFVKIIPRRQFLPEQKPTYFNSLRKQNND